MNIRSFRTLIIAVMTILLTLAIGLFYLLYLENKAGEEWHNKYLADATTTAEFAPRNPDSEKVPFIAESAPFKMEGVELWCVKYGWSTWDGTRRYDTAITTDRTLKPGDPVNVRLLRTTNDNAEGDWDNTRRISIVVRAEAVTPPPPPAEKP